MASLALVSPGVTTDGVVLFFRKKMTTFLVIALCKVMTFISCRLVTTPTFLHLPTSFVQCSFYIQPHFLKNHSGVTPLDGVTRDSPPPSHFNDATGHDVSETTSVVNFQQLLSVRRFLSQLAKDNLLLLP